MPTVTVTVDAEVELELSHIDTQDLIDEIEDRGYHVTSNADLEDYKDINDYLTEELIEELELREESVVSLQRWEWNKLYWALRNGDTATAIELTKDLLYQATGKHV